MEADAQNGMAKEDERYEAFLGEAAFYQDMTSPSGATHSPHHDRPQESSLLKDSRPARATHVQREVVQVIGYHALTKMADPAVGSRPKPRRGNPQGSDGSTRMRGLLLLTTREAAIASDRREVIGWMGCMTRVVVA